MEKKVCEICSGEYLPVQADGSSYAHACPPLIDPETGEARERPDKRDENPPHESFDQVLQRELKQHER